MQSEKLAFGKPVGASRVREVWFSKQGAKDSIGPVEEEYIKCKTCGNSHSNPAVDLDHNFKNWKKKLFIQEFDVQEETNDTDQN